MKKLISILLLSVMLLSALVACGGDKQTGSGGGETSGDSTYLPNVDFEGYTFRWLASDNSYGIAVDEGEERDESSTLYQAEVARDSEIADRFNVKFEDVKSGAPGEIVAYVIKDALNPSSSYDVGHIGGPENASDVIAMNLVEDANDMPMLDLSKEWYAQQANEEFSIYGKQFFIAAAYPDMPGSPQFLFNKNMILEKNMDLPYDIILSGNWTIEELMKYTTVGYSNFNTNDPGIDGLDKFGYAGHDRSVCYFYQGFAGQTTSRSSNGSVVPVLANDTIDAYYDKLLEFYNDKANWTNSNLEAGDATSSHRVFYDGRAMFCYWVTGTLAHSKIETFEKGLGILPKYNLDQEKYCCPTVGGIKLFPANLEDPYTTGYLYESLCEASWRLVYPASIQEAVDFQELTDEESIEVKKLVDQSLTYDILKNIDPTGNKLSSCGFMWESLRSEVPPSILAQLYEDAYKLLFEEFYDKVWDNINK